MWRSSEYRWTHDISTAGTFSIPASAGRRARLRRRRRSPSWSVSDITVTPASAAARATSAGSSWPSETVEWACRSITGARSAILARPCRTGRCGHAPRADHRESRLRGPRGARARRPPRTASPIKGERLAESQGIPLQFLEHILLELKHARLIQCAVARARGGYWLARPTRRRSRSPTSSAPSRARSPTSTSTAPEELHYRRAGGEAARRLGRGPGERCARCSRTRPLAEVSAGNTALAESRPLLNDPEAWLKR